MNRESNELIAEIVSVFSSRERPTRGEILSRSYGDEDEIEFCLDKSWMDLSTGRASGKLYELPLLATQDFAYFLPAVLVHVLSRKRGQVDMLERMAVRFICQSLPHWDNVESLFSESERDVIRDFLRVVETRNAGQEFPISIDESCLNKWS